MISTAGVVMNEWHFENCTRMKLQAIVGFLLCAFRPLVEAATGDDNSVEFCPEGTVQLALESVMKDSSGFTCAQAVGTGSQWRTLTVD
ncbi:unnamed protein product [Aphanomyces euteiches]